MSPAFPVKLEAAPMQLVPRLAKAVTAHTLTMLDSTASSSADTLCARSFLAAGQPHRQGAGSPAARRRRRSRPAAG